MLPPEVLRPGGDRCAIISRRNPNPESRQDMKLYLAPGQGLVVTRTWQCRIDADWFMRGFYANRHLSLDRDSFEIWAFMHPTGEGMLVIDHISGARHLVTQQDPCQTHLTPSGAVYHFILGEDPDQAELVHSLVEAAYQKPAH